MKGEDIFSTDGVVREIYYDTFKSAKSFHDQDKHRICNIELLLHNIPGMDKDSLARAKKTIKKLEEQLWTSHIQRTDVLSAIKVDQDSREETMLSAQR